MPLFDPVLSQLLSLDLHSDARAEDRRSKTLFGAQIFFYINFEARNAGRCGRLSRVQMG